MCGTRDVGLQGAREALVYVGDVETPHGGVVDQDIETAKGPFDLGCGVADRLRVCDVEVDGGDGAERVQGFDRGLCGCGFGGRAGGEDDVVVW